MNCSDIEWSTHYSEIKNICKLNTNSRESIIDKVAPDLIIYKPNSITVKLTKTIKLKITAILTRSN